MDTAQQAVVRLFTTFSLRQLCLGCSARGQRPGGWQTPTKKLWGLGWHVPSCNNSFLQAFLVHAPLSLRRSWPAAAPARRSTSLIYPRSSSCYTLRLPEGPTLCCLYKANWQYITQRPSGTDRAAGTTQCSARLKQCVSHPHNHPPTPKNYCGVRCCWCAAVIPPIPASPPAKPLMQTLRGIRVNAHRTNNQCLCLPDTQLQAGQYTPHLPSCHHPTTPPPTSSPTHQQQPHTCPSLPTTPRLNPTSARQNDNPPQTHACTEKLNHKTTHTRP